ncbi:hypothetical protein K1719_043688 [Acacia pycnantha]|nr:hypothetical protein K1719_043688 [Acacia pycnantha]
MAAPIYSLELGKLVLGRAHALGLASVALSLGHRKVALITGAARGVGECTATLFVKHRAKVEIADILEDLGEAVSKTIPYSTYGHCNVTKQKDIANAVDTAVSKYGKLDIMFNNAGINSTVNSDSILENDLEYFKRVISVNLTGVFLGTKHAARVMIPAGRGKLHRRWAYIINTVVFRADEEQAE